MYSTREYIEQTIKEQNIDRKRFFEVSKQNYKNLIYKIEETFVQQNSKNHRTIHWANMGYFNENIDWIGKSIRNMPLWYHLLPKIVLSPEKPIYVLFEDTKAYQPKYWLYEAFIPELITILDKSYYFDYYIVSKKFDWLISENHEQIVCFVGNNLKTSVLKEIE